MFSFYFFVVPHLLLLRPMGLNGLGYQSHLLQRCRPACGHGGSSHLFSVLASVFIRAALRQPMVEISGGFGVVCDLTYLVQQHLGLIAINSSVLNGLFDT